MNNISLSSFGEIIISELTCWTIQCWHLDTYPAFGSLIVVEYDHTCCFGVVSRIQTQANDKSRTPFAFGKTRQELQQEQPHIFQLLHTTVQCIPLSYKDHHHIIHEIPQRSAPIHTFAGVASAALLKDFFESPAWLITFFNLAQHDPLFDELLIALLRTGHQQGALQQKNIQEIIDIFSLMTHSDYRKLKIFLQRIEIFID